MNLIKVKGIVIKETQYKDNDKIITILTDKLGKVSCIAKGAKRTNSPILACSQYLVYSEFILYKGNNFYYINSASVINTFYNLRIDLDKLQVVFDLTKLIQNIVDENEDTSSILKLFLNTIYVIENYDKNIKVVVATFKIKLFDLLGYSPRIDKCSICGEQLYKKENNEGKNADIKLNNIIYYDYVSNTFCCEDCIKDKDKRRYIELSKTSVIAIKYVLASEIKKIFSFNLKESKDYEIFGQVYADTMSNGI